MTHPTKPEPAASARASPEEPLRVMALHALAYCERLFYLEEVEEIRVADDRVFAGRALHEDVNDAGEDEDGERLSLEMTDLDLGLTGRADALRRRDGALIPYEHKRGRSRQEDGKPAPWSSDALQVAAYALLLESETGEPIQEARIRYHADNVTVRLPIDDQARASVRDAVARARELRRSMDRPPVADNDRVCIRCSLAPVCLPEEDRLGQSPDWEPVRLFPPERERIVLHVSEAGARIGRSGDALQVKTPEGGKESFPVQDLEAVVLHGYPQITTQALHFCARNDVAVHWVTGPGNYVAGLSAGAGGVHRRIRQYRGLDDAALRLQLARRLVMARGENHLRYLLRATRGMDRDAEPLHGGLQGLRNALRAASRAPDVDSLRGHEGMAARAWYVALPALFREETPEALRFTRRSRRPPRDPFNALLGFGYSLLYRTVLQALLAVGLEPALGFYHTPRSSAQPLVLDLMEIFRLPVWDIPLIGSINRMQWDPEADFQRAGPRVWLSDTGRRKAIALFENRLEEQWRHPVLKYSLSYFRLVELEARLLEKEWSGQTGLFARMRLR